jgi:CRP/FNR family cyclic AMP-dependent transcriptional regulator
MADLSGFQRFAKTYQKGEILFSEYEPGDSFYLIQSGRVQISKIMGDIEKTLDVLQPPEIFGEMAILEDAPRSATATAIDNVNALELNRANFEVLMMGNPQIAFRLLKLFTKRIYDQKRRFMILMLDDPTARVADVFIMLSEMQPPPPDTERRDLKTTPDDIAHWSGMSSDEVRNILQHFVTQRRIEILPDKIIVKNINELQRLVNAKRKNK